MDGPREEKAHPAEQMADIFVSYAREDFEAAEQLAVAMEERGWSVFWDRRIPAGRRFADVIEQQLALARCVIALWSKASNESDWVLDEAEYARKRNILTPARIEEVEPPWGFRRINAADLIGWKGDTQHAGFQRLLEDILGSIGESHLPASTSSPSAPTSASVANAARNRKGAEAERKPRDEMEGIRAGVVRATAHREKPVVTAPPTHNVPAKPGARMFEQLKRGIQAFRPDASWAVYAGKSYEGWWFLTDPNGQRLVRVKLLTNLLRVRICASSGYEADQVNSGGWIKENESSVARDDKDVSRILKQIRSEWP
jgi:hypothetical protein